MTHVGPVVTMVPVASKGSVAVWGGKNSGQYSNPTGGWEFLQNFCLDIPAVAQGKTVSLSTAQFSVPAGLSNTKGYITVLQPAKECKK
jgi:hypothetical protein